MQTGTVKVWRSTYGFIKRADDGRDVFVHFSGIVGDGYRVLDLGDRVEFEMGTDPKKAECAVNVRVLDAGVEQ